MNNKLFHYIYLTKIYSKKANYYYVGKHSTKNLDDGYFGSGLLVKKICKKYPFKTKILKMFNSEIEAYKAEEILVQKAKLKYGKHSLNIAEGGLGKKKGTKLSDLTKRKMSLSKIGSKWSLARRESSLKTISNKGKNHYSNRIGFSESHRAKIGLASKRNKGFKHSKKSISAMSEAKIGNKNPMFGKPSAMKGKPAGNRNNAWKYFDELKFIWDENKLSPYLFKKLAVSLGYPNCSYRGLISKWQA